MGKATEELEILEVVAGKATEELEGVEDVGKVTEELEVVVCGIRSRLPC